MRLQADTLTKMDVLMGGVDRFKPNLSLVESFLIVSGHYSNILRKEKNGVTGYGLRTDGPTDRPTDGQDLL